MRSFDVVVIGSGSAGKPFTGELSRAGRTVAVVEQSLVGGECPYLACVPSKAMLLAARRHRLAEGRCESPDAEAFAAAVAVRDKAVHQRDDALAVKGLTEDGAELFRGHAVVEPGRRVVVDDATELEYGALVIATGAQAVVPPIDGISTAPVWTSDQALSSAELPSRLVILGGGPIGVELSQVYASFGSSVTLVESAPTLLPDEAAWVGEAMAETLSRNGVSVHIGTTVSSVSTSSTSPAVVHAADRSWDCDRILVAVGKSPRVSGFGLDVLGLDLEGAPEVDGRLRVLVRGRPLPDVFAIGDVTGIAPFTHTANYQARTAAAHILGRGVDADYTGVPRVVYTDPAVFAAGLTAEQAGERDIDVRTARFDPSDVTRSALEGLAGTIEQAPTGLELVADASSGVLLGAAVVAPEADAWGHELALAVRTGRTVHELAEALHAYPSWAEAVHPPARELAERIARR